MEKISIITPSLNQCEFIEKTIQSVREQNYKNYEHIIVDGGSTDGTLEILEKYKNMLTYISEKDSGQVDAINKGLRMASGDILAFINSDDYYLPDTFNIVANAFRESSKTWLVGSYKIIDESDKEIHKYVATYKELLRTRANKNLLYIANYIPQPSTFWRRSIIDKVGFFDKKYNYAFDYEYWLRLYRIEDPIVVEDKLSAFRIHRTSKGFRYYGEQLNEEIKIVREKKMRKIYIDLHIINNMLVKFIYRYIK